MSFFLVSLSFLFARFLRLHCYCWLGTLLAAYVTIAFQAFGNWGGGRFSHRDATKIHEYHLDNHTGQTSSCPQSPLKRSRFENTARAPSCFTMRRPSAAHKEKHRQQRTSVYKSTVVSRVPAGWQRTLECNPATGMGLHSAPTTVLPNHPSRPQICTVWTSGR
jgi:hypothetical protein